MVKKTIKGRSQMEYPRVVAKDASTFSKVASYDRTFNDCPDITRLNVFQE